LYITGASGSGKSYYSAEYIKQYIKKHPKNEVMLFSSVGDDAVLDKIKKVKRFKIHNGDFVGEQFSIDDFKDCLLIFDDVDCISSKPILKKVYEILDKALTTGRHTGTSVVYTTHTACNGKATKLIHQSTINQPAIFFCLRYISVDSSFYVKLIDHTVIQYYIQKLSLARNLAGCAYGLLLIDY
jgi:hypothetical protein